MTHGQAELLRIRLIQERRNLTEFTGRIVAYQRAYAVDDTMISDQLAQIINHAADVANDLSHGIDIIEAML